MQNKKLPIRKFVSYLNDEESEGGGFWLPNIQRPFVWSEEQITRLFDSIMREYPIGALLVWKTKETVKHRKFIDNYHRDIRLTDFYAPENRHSKMLVLDGQQRLQSLFIGLKGSYSGTDRELYFDVLSGNAAAPEDIRYRFAFIRSDKALPSYLALIPLIYYRYHYPQKFASATGLQEYLLRSLVTGVFSGSPDNLIDKIVRNIQEQQDFIPSEIFGVIRADNRSLEITPDVIFDQYYGSRTIHLFFNLWYQDFNYTPALDANGPQIDHIFPQSLLKTVKDVNPDSGNRNILHYRSGQRDQIANCMLLTAEENGFGGKCDTPPDKWFAQSRFPSKEAQAGYFKLHLIPSDPELWKIENFDQFIKARESLIENKFSRMLRPSGEKA